MDSFFSHCRKLKIEVFFLTQLLTLAGKSEEKWHYQILGRKKDNCYRMQRNVKDVNIIEMHSTLQCYILIMYYNMSITIRNRIDVLQLARQAESALRI